MKELQIVNWTHTCKFLYLWEGHILSMYEKVIYIFGLYIDELEHTVYAFMQLVQVLIKTYISSD